MSSADKPFAITLDVGSSLANHTGSWRTERPVYVRKTAPCGGACPAGEDVQQWLYDAEEGGYEAAWRKIMERNPFPSVCGRVCYHPCETACNRAQLDEAVGINSVERFLGDQAIAEGWTIEPPRELTGKRILVVGAGPAGLSAAYHLALLGHTVSVRDAAPAAGGMLRYGIPKYRLPRDVLDAEIGRIRDLGVSFELSHNVPDVVAEKHSGDFDAVFLAVGARLGSLPCHSFVATARVPVARPLRSMKRKAGSRPTTTIEPGGSGLCRETNGWSIQPPASASR